MKIKWFSLDEVLTWDSFDVEEIMYWATEQSDTLVELAQTGPLMPVAVEKVRTDRQYKTVLESLHKYGFRKPLRYRDDFIRSDRVEHCDGHHRFAAGIELGYKWFPYLKSEYVADDSWGFARHNFHKISSINRCYVHPENPLPTVLPRSSHQIIGV